MHPTENHGSVLTDVFGGHAQSYVGSGDAVTVWFIYIYIYNLLQRRRRDLL